MDNKKSIKIGFTCITFCLIGLALVPAATADDDGGYKFDWQWYTTDHIGEYSKAPSGYSYVVATIYIKNDGIKLISTNPFYWSLIVDGIKYIPDAATYDSPLHHQNVNVMTGGETETSIVFLVKGKPHMVKLKYDELLGPTLTRISHYDHSNEYRDGSSY
jgi:hypothetical protein